MLVTCVHPALSLMGMLQLNPQLLSISSDARICVLGDAPPPSWDALPDIRLGFLDHAISLSLSQPLHSSLTCGRKVELTEWSAVFQSSTKFQIAGTVGIVTHYSTTFCGQLADSFTPLVLSPAENCYSTLLNRPLWLTVWISLVCWAWEGL